MSIASMADAKMAVQIAKEGTEIKPGRALPDDVFVSSPMILAKGTTLGSPLELPGGTALQSDTPLADDTLVPAGSKLPKGTVVTQPAKQSSGSQANVVNQLTRWIPSESILLYVALLGLFDPLEMTSGQNVADLDFRSRWIAYLAFVGVTILLVLVLTAGKANRDPAVSFEFPFFAFFAAPVAFSAWAAALPNSPFLDLVDYRPAFGGFAVLVVTVAISVAAWALNESPDFETIVE